MQSHGLRLVALETALRQLTLSSPFPPRVREIVIVDTHEDGSEHLLERGVWAPGGFVWEPATDGGGPVLGWGQGEPEC